MQLLTLQRAFAAALRSNSDPRGLEMSPAGFSVYLNNYRAQLRASLRDSFPHLLQWLGESEFDRAAEAHIRRSPPVSWTLDDYGCDFTTTLRELFPSDREIEELAWLDAAMAQAFVGRDDVPLSHQDLPGIDWENARLTFVASMRLSRVRSNAADIWIALEEQRMPPAAAVLPEQHAHLVWRQGMKPVFRLISMYEHEFIETLAAGLPFGRVCKILGHCIGEELAILTAGEFLGRWLNEELLTRVDD